MPSIFIWKATVPNTSKKYIRYYSGSNWFLEDNDYSSSYMYLQQIVIPECHDSVITFHVKKMPSDWVGADLLEVNQVPISTIKSDNYGTLEHIGNWWRFTSKEDIPFTRENLIQEFEKIKQWKEDRSSSVSTTPQPREYHSKHIVNRTSQTINPGKYSSTYQRQQYHRSQEYPQQQQYQQRQQYQHPETLPSMSLDVQSVHQNFKEFLHQFNINNILHTQMLHNSHIPISIPLVSHTTYR